MFDWTEDLCDLEKRLVEYQGDLERVCINGKNLFIHSLGIKDMPTFGPSIGGLFLLRKTVSGLHQSSGYMNALIRLPWRVKSRTTPSSDAPYIRGLNKCNITFPLVIEVKVILE